jgi:hypothetical protein
MARIPAFSESHRGLFLTSALFRAGPNGVSLEDGQIALVWNLICQSRSQARIWVRDPDLTGIVWAVGQLDAPKATKIVP